MRDFAVVDQDQSDNVVTSYLMNANGQIAQNTAANTAALTGATTLVNGSDDKLLAAFLDPATGCTPFTAPDITDPAGSSASQALNELSARVNQQGVIAVVPPNDEMTLVNGAYSIAKTNVYRSLVDQPLLPANTDATQVAMAYCQNMIEHRAGPQPAGHGPRAELRLAGRGHRQQPRHVPGQPAGHVLRQPGLQ